MREMKNSQIPWVGEIPCTWKVIRNKNLMHRVKDICAKYNGEDILSLTMNGVIVRDLNNPMGKMPTTFDGYQRIKTGNLLLCLFDIDVTPRCVGRIFNDGLTSPAYSHFALKENAKQDYYYYYYLSLDHTKELLHLAKNLRHTLTEEQFGSIDTPVPPETEQEQISRFLDNKCSLVDTLIANQEKQIEKLKQYKQSLITEVVTKGLDPNAPMKDSGVEWVGLIPKKWTIQKVKFATNVRDEKYESGHFKYIALENIESLSGRFLETESTYDLEGTKKAYTGDVIFGKLRPYLGKVLDIRSEVCVSSEFAVFEPKKLTTDFLKYLMLSYGFIDYVDSSTYGTKMPRANIIYIKNMYIPIPPLKDQEQIVSVIRNKFENIQKLIEIKQEKIEKLNQYKKSIIYEYVTGKKEVV